MRKNRNFFWPLILIGTGALILLANLGVIEFISLYQLVNLWPLILIGVGINLMFGRQNEWLGLALGVTMVAVVVLFLVFAPQLDLPGFYSATDMQTDNFSELMGTTESYQLNVNSDIGHVTVTENSQNSNLVDVEMLYISDSNSHFEVSGTTQKEITVNLDNNEFWFNPMNWMNNDGTYINIDLNSSIPAGIQIDHSSGNIDLQLAKFELVNFTANLSSGTLDVTLPSGSYPILLDISSGNMYVDFSEGMVLDFDAEISTGGMTLDLSDELLGSMMLDMSTGTIKLNIPESLGVRIEGEISTGSVNFPSNFTKVFGNGNLTGEDGAWENEAYDPDGQNLVITFDISSGNLIIVIID